MNVHFGDAIIALKQGKMIRRASWHPNTFVFMQIPSTIEKEIVPRMQSLPPSVKDAFMRRFNDKEMQVSEIAYNHQLAIVNQSNLITGYCPSADDVLSNDWIISK
jgi:hypothetical protein